MAPRTDVGGYEPSDYPGLTCLDDPAWRHQHEQGAPRARVPAVFIDLLEVMGDR
jgi:hypothetical protein